MQTEFEFCLPRGYVDSTGEIHKKGIMRLATAADEILPLRDPRVQQNPSNLTVLLLARVVTRLDTLNDINIAFLQDMYRHINAEEAPVYKITCSHRRKVTEVPVDLLQNWSHVNDGIRNGTLVRKTYNI